MAGPSATNEGNTLSPDFPGEERKAIFEWETAVWSRRRAAEKMSRRGQQPKSPDLQRGTNLILIKGQPVFARAEIDLNRPVLCVKSQRLIGAERDIRTDENA